jgi:2-methylcitrate dehydratase
VPRPNAKRRRNEESVPKKHEGGDKADTTVALARAIQSAPPPSLSALQQAKLLLLDTVGCGILGARDGLARAVLATCAKTGEHAVIGHAARTGLLDAVLANGVAIRVADLNDYLVNMANGEPETGGHPSDNIPSALAVGAARRRSGTDILSAIVIGYELYARMQRMLDRAGLWDGVTVSGLVVPAIAGRLMDLTQTQLSHALALGLSRAATPSIVRRGTISATKSTANAMVAQSGIQAALLAEQGVTGPLAILDDRHGLTDIFADPDMPALSAPLPGDGAILRAHMKAYPCVNTAQSAVATALALRSQLRAPAGRIELVMADYPVVARQQADESRMWPQTRESADHSILFVAAVSLIDGAFGLKQFENERWRDPEVLALMKRMTLTRADFRNHPAKSPFPCAIRARDTAGRDYAVGPIDPPGASKDGLDETAVIAKFHANTEGLLPPAARAAIVEACLNFDLSPSTETLDTAIAIEETNR